MTGDLGVIYAGSSDGYVYAMLERAGDLLWKFAASDPVIDSPVVIKDRVYAATEMGGMFCINAKTGKLIWWAPEVLHFVAAGKQRVYAADKLGRLRILDAGNGAVLDSLPASIMPIRISNGQTDRIYLATEGGIIQCLREVEQTNPLVYNESGNAAVGQRSAQAAAESQAQERRCRCPEGGARAMRRRRSPRPRRTMPPTPPMPIPGTSLPSPPKPGRRRQSQGRRQGQEESSRPTPAETTPLAAIRTNMASPRDEVESRSVVMSECDTLLACRTAEPSCQ